VARISPKEEFIAASGLRIDLTWGVAISEQADISNTLHQDLYFTFHLSSKDKQ